MLGVIWKWKKRRKRYIGDVASVVMKTAIIILFRDMQSGSTGEAV